MRFSYFIAVAAAFLSTSAVAQLPPQSKKQREVFRACVMAAADRFAKGPDPADVIARAAMVACKDDSVRLSAQLAEDGIPAKTANSIQDILEKLFADEAILRVVEARAKR